MSNLQKTICKYGENDSSICAYCEVAYEEDIEIIINQNRGIAIIVTWSNTSNVCLELAFRYKTLMLMKIRKTVIVKILKKINYIKYDQLFLYKFLRPSFLGIICLLFA